MARGTNRETGVAGSCAPFLEQSTTGQSLAAGLGVVGVASGLVAVNSQVRRRHGQGRRRLVLHAGDDFIVTVQREAQKQVDSALEGPKKAQQAVELKIEYLRDGLGNLQAAPQELGGKLSTPFVTTATVVADSAKALAEASSRAQDGKAVEKVSGSVGNLAAIPGAVKSRLFDAPVAAIQGAGETANKILGVPAKLISRTQDTVNSAQKVLGGLVALPGRLKDRVEGTVGSAARAFSAVAALPGQFSDDINSRVSGVQNGVSRVQNAASGFAQSAEAVIRLPGQTVAGISKTIEDVGQKTESVATGVSNATSGFMNASDGVAKLPSRAQETASKAGNLASIPGTLLKPVGDALGGIKSQIDGDSQEPEKGSKK